MYYEPKYFKPQELFSRPVYKREKHRGSDIWRLMDHRILITADLLRGRFGKMRINDWLWGGQLQLRGYRDIFEDIIGPEKLMSVTSQHCFGRAIDYNFERVEVQEVIEDIQANPYRREYIFITGLELDTETWVHNDTRCWSKDTSGLFTFNA